MTRHKPSILMLSRDLPVSRERVWNVLTTPALMRRWMLIPGVVVPDAPLSLGSRIEWHDDNGTPYLIGTVIECLQHRRLTVELRDRSWPRPAMPGEVVWSFTLTSLSGGARLDYRLGDLAIDANAEGWLAAYTSADEPARLAKVIEDEWP